MRTKNISWSRIFLTLNVIAFSVAFYLNFWAGQHLHINARIDRRHGRDPSQTLYDHYPLFQSAEYSPMRFDAELGASSIFKGDPRDELDKAWKSIVDMPMILVDKETLDSFDRTTKPSKGINDHYYATVEVFHQLHCLDITRKFIWRNHYGHVDTFQDPPEMIWEHVDHCIDLIRQVLMCNSDIGLIFYTDVGNRQPVARVSTSHMCRNFSQIVDWVNRHDSELGVFAEDKHA